MPFPNAEHAVVSEEKIQKYLLNPNHPVGGFKAAWFASIGYTLDNWEELAIDLMRLAKSSENFIAKSSPFGVKYEVIGEIGRSNRTGIVVSIWIVDQESLPRLVTAYPG